MRKEELNKITEAIIGAAFEVIMTSNESPMALSLNLSL